MTFGGDEYVFELCNQHADMFQRDMFGWARLGTIMDEDDYATFRRAAKDDDGAGRGTVIAAHIEVPVVRESRLPESRQPVSPQQSRPLSFAERAAKQVVGSLPAGFEKWTFSDHALERQGARGVSRAEALWCSAEPDVVTPGSRPNTLIHRRGHVETVVNPALQRIVTVINLNLDSNSRRENSVHAAS